LNILKNLKNVKEILVVVCQKYLIGAEVLPVSGMILHMLRIIFANRILGNMRNGMFDKTNDKPLQCGGGQTDPIPALEGRGLSFVLAENFLCP